MASAEPPPRSRLRRFIVTSFKLGLGALLIMTIAVGVAVAVAVNQLPSYAELIRRDDLGQMVRIRAADGTIIHTQGPSFGEWLPSAEIPTIMRDAIVSVEDRRFYSHIGVDPIGIVRSLIVRLQRGVWAQGGSTLTQQLARNIFLTNDRSFVRKVREAILAMALEWRFSKDQILELYLNRVYFGGGAFGIDSASRRFFGHSAARLSVGEAAMIAGLVKAPSNYAPTADAAAARGRARARVVLGEMVEYGAITPAQAAEANPDQVRIAENRTVGTRTRYFVDWILPQLDTLIDETVQPIDVWTTVHLGMQEVAERAIAANAPNGVQGALVSLDRDGAVRAMVGGLDYRTSSYNRATQATRQPGSSFKLFVYLAGLEAGLTPDTPILDAPISIGNWSPRNSNGRFSGPIPMRQALAYSVNTVAVRIAQQVGTQTVADMAQRLGITTRISTFPSMALGSSEVRLIDMVRAYATVARGGVGVTPYGIRRVTTADGTLIYQHQDDQSRVLLQPWVAQQMTDMLAGVVSRGTARSADLGRPTAGKTGTTSSSKDAWFIGFSSGLTTGVWMGRDDNRAIPGFAGGQAPARTFHDFMIRAVARRPVEPFPTDAQAPDWPTGDAENQLLEVVPPDDEGPLVDPDGGPIERPQPDDEDPYGRDAARPEDQVPEQYEEETY